MTALLINDVPIECINVAAIIYHVPATMIISVLKTENGRNGMAKRNINGTYDYGPMQINSSWLPKIAPYGYTKDDLQYNPCANVAVGSWILSQGIAERGSLWRGVGDYHSHAVALNQPYSYKVKNFYQWLQKKLSSP